jgi:hypothetical protein
MAKWDVKVFAKKYYPTAEGGDFFQNPQGLTLIAHVRWDLREPAYLCFYLLFCDDEK